MKGSQLFLLMSMFLLISTLCCCGSLVNQDEIGELIALLPQDWVQRLGIALPAEETTGAMPGAADIDGAPGLRPDAELDPDGTDDPLDPPADDPLDPVEDDPVDPPADDPLDPPEDDPVDPPADDPVDPVEDDPIEPDEPEWRTGIPIIDEVLEWATHFGQWVGLVPYGEGEAGRTIWRELLDILGESEDDPVVGGLGPEATPIATPQVTPTVEEEEEEDPQETQYYFTFDSTIQLTKADGGFYNQRYYATVLLEQDEGSGVFRGQDTAHFDPMALHWPGWDVFWEDQENLIDVMLSFDHERATLHASIRISEPVAYWRAEGGSEGYERDGQISAYIWLYPHELFWRTWALGHKDTCDPLRTIYCVLDGDWHWDSSDPEVLAYTFYEKQFTESSPYRVNEPFTATIFTTAAFKAVTD